VIADYTVRAGDTEPVWADVLAYSDGTPANLRGAAVSLLVRSLASPAPLTLTGTVSVPSPPESGQVQYRPSPADTAIPGPYLAQWQVVFADGSSQSWPTVGYLWMMIEEALTSSTLTIGCRPSVTDVAGLLRARTKVRGGGEAGTFNTETRPTGTEVEGLIDDAMDDVLTRVQAPTAGSDYERRVRGAIRLYAAVLVEMSYFPEQAKSNHSPAAMYQTLYASRLKSLIAYGEVGRPGGMGEGGSGGDAPPDAAWSFAIDPGGIGYQAW
jgi:hypothetical protein